MKRRVLGDIHPHTAACMSSLGELYRIQARYEEAEPLLIQAMEAYRQTLGEQHRHTFVPMYSLALVYKEQGLPLEAEKLIRQVFEGRRRILGRDDPKTIEAQHDLAVTLVTLDEYDEAECLAEDMLNLLRENPQTPPDMLAESLELLADILMQGGRPQAAEPLLRECLQLQRASLPEGDRLTATTMSRLGGCLTALERFEEAETLLLESYARLESPEEEPGSETRAACQRVIDLYDAWAKPAQAAQWRGTLGACGNN